VGAIRLVVSGATGKMGRLIGGMAAADPAFEVVGGLDRPGASAPEFAAPIAAPADAAALLRRADVLVDFSAPVFLGQLLEAHSNELEGRALVVGTTGLASHEEALLDALARRSPVLTAANFSPGVNLLVALAEQAAAVLGETYDVEIVEAHHREKRDAPSGTALALANAVASARHLDLAAGRRDGRSGAVGPRTPHEIGIHALRGGMVVGDHHVHFLGEAERIELTHRASDRAAFASGALRASRWLVGREPGRYSMRDVLKL
jgi:4-hydroxy-tetrahydrodipicolinate reductase